DGADDVFLLVGQLESKAGLVRHHGAHRCGGATLRSAGDCSIRDADASTCATASTRSRMVAWTRTSACVSASIFEAAVPRVPWTSAPACPMVTPSGAVVPASKAKTGLLKRWRRSASANSS